MYFSTATKFFFMLKVVRKEVITCEHEGRHCSQFHPTILSFPGATALPRMTAPTAEEMGMADSVYVDELGDTSVVVFKVGDKESRVSTIVVRGSTDNYMDDIERAIDDGVNVFKGLCKVRSALIGNGPI